MSRIGAFSGVELLAGEHEGVGATVDGEVFLASRNRFPNGDLEGFGAGGELEGNWELLCPERPDAWNAYVRQVTAILGSGAHSPKRDTLFQKQNLSRLPYPRSFYAFDSPVVPGGTLPGRGKRAKIAPPSEAPVVKVVTVAGSAGLPAGVYPVMWAKVMGEDPHRSKRITQASPAVNVTVAQGQFIAAYLPDVSALEEGVTGVLLVVGLPNQGPETGRAQRVVETARATEDRYLIRSFRRDGRIVTPTSGNKTRIGAPNQHPPPKAWIANHAGDLGAFVVNERGERLVRDLPMRVELSYALGTDEGPTASQQTVTVPDIGGVQEGSGLYWRPENPPDGATRWRPEFFVRDGNWYTVSTAGSSEGWLPIDVPAVILTDQVGDNWRGPGTPLQVERLTADESGVEDPDAALEDALAEGAAALKPGRYRARTTNEADGEESAPSPPATFELRDSGLAAGQAATGVTDQMARIYRPAVQKIVNEMLVDRGPTDHAIDWEAPSGLTVPSVSVNSGEGTLRVNDTTGAQAIADIRQSAPFGVNPNAKSVFRCKVSMTSHAGGQLAVQMRFLDAGGAQIGSRINLERVGAVGVAKVRATMGPADSNAEIEVPANAVTRQVVFRHVGDAALGGRSFFYVASNIGLWSGHGANRKRWPVDLGLDAKNNSKRKAGPEQDDRPYPAGPFCHVVEPDAGERAYQRNATILERVKFEDGLDPAGWTRTHSQSDAGHVFAVLPGAAINGDYGARITSDGTGAGAYAARYRKSFVATGRNSLGVRVLYRVPFASASGEFAIAAVTRSATFSDYLAELRFNAATGQIVAHYRSGASSFSAVVASGVESGAELDVEVVCEGGNSLAGKVTANVRRNERPNTRVELASLDFSAQTIHSAVVGVASAPATAAFKLVMDDIIVTLDGLRETDPVPGNMIEYWAPDGTPYSSKFFATGEKLPLRPGARYVTSVFAGCEGVEKAAMLFQAAIKDDRGEVVRELAPIVPKLRGYEGWDRYWISYDVPEDGAYLEFASNRVADGLIRAMGFQHETVAAGVDKPSASTNLHSPSGFVTATVRTSAPPRPRGRGPAKKSLGETVAWLRALAVVNHERNAANTGWATSHTLHLRSGGTLAELDAAPWRAGLAALLANEGIKELVDIRVDLATAELDKTPVLSGAFLVAQRKYPILTRADGTEFRGGAAVFGLSAVRRPRNVVRPEYADGTRGLEDYTRGVPPKLLRCGIQVFDRETAEEIHFLQGHDSGEFGVEADGTRYQVVFAGAVLEEGEMDVGNPGNAVMYVAEGVEADVELEKPL